MAETEQTKFVMTQPTWPSKLTNFASNKMLKFIFLKMRQFQEKNSPKFNKRLKTTLTEQQLKADSALKAIFLEWKQNIEKRNKNYALSYWQVTSTSSGLKWDESNVKVNARKLNICRLAKIFAKSEIGPTPWFPLIISGNRAHPLVKIKLIKKWKIENIFQ